MATNTESIESETVKSKTTQSESKTMDAPVEPVDLTRSDLYINRELSVLEFNQRVLEQAKDSDVPLLERLRFLCISTTNMDEFFEVRVAGFIQKAELGSTATGPDKMLPNEVLNAIGERAHRLVD
jgi:polyphosphate kinase